MGRSITFKLLNYHLNFKMEGENNLWGTRFNNSSTKAIHDGQEPEQWKSMMVVPPITMSSTYKQAVPGVTAGFDYSRGGNPTRKVLETCVASLEGGKYGMAFSSGLGACMTVVNMLKSGDHVITTDDVYGGTNRYFQKVAAKFGVTFSFVDFTDVTNVKNAITPETAMIWCESPTNPTMKVTDLRAVATTIKESKQEIIFVVDNTFMTPYFQRPLMLGADIVMHSATKYMNGHSDVVIGLLICERKDLYDRLYFLQMATGPVPSPFDCYLCNRGLKTLALRMEQHQKNAIIVNDFLEKSDDIESQIRWFREPSPVRNHEKTVHRSLRNDRFVGEGRSRTKLQVSFSLESLHAR